MIIFGNKHKQHKKMIKKLFENRCAFTKIASEQHIENILYSLAEIYRYDLDKCDYTKYKEIFDSYETIAIRKVMYDFPIWRSIKSLQWKYSSLITNDDIALKACLFSCINFANNDFSLANKEDKENFEFCYTVANGAAPLNPDITLKDRIMEFDVNLNIADGPISVAKNEEGYYFDNNYEYIAYVCSDNEKKNVAWLNGSFYYDMYLQAYKEFDAGNLQRAKDLYLKSMEYNPVAIGARFELTEICKKSYFAKDAVKFLNGAFKYLFSKKDIAGFYRRYAFIATDLNQPYLASALLQYSMCFERSSVAMSELEYIKKYEPESDDYINIDIEGELKKHNIPRITIGESAMRLIKQIEENTEKHSR